VHPDFIRKEGVRHVNHTQRTPYVSSTARDDPETYEALQLALKDVCAYVSAVIKKHLPEIHSELSVFCDILPLNVRPTTYPFPGLVINLQVSTEGHLDGGDDIICAVIPFGEFENGDLVLLEAGLIVDIREGDFFIFPSFDLTHFNLFFKGVRGSIVMHSDKDGLRWKENRNGWHKHMAMCSI
jgi:hypothetical protein